MEESKDEEKDEIFTAILASSVHNMKNALGLLMNTIDEISGCLKPSDGELFDKITFLEVQSSRLNNDLMQLLSLYKMDQEQYPFQTIDTPLNEFLEEQSLRYALLLQHKGFRLTVECDELLSWSFDQDLIAGVLNDAIGNAIKYTKHNIVLRAEQHGSYLRISVEDDGPGFPEQLLARGHEGAKGISFDSGSTGLGLYFCSMVARMHKEGGRVGFVEVDNKSQLGGGRFSLLIP